jgi:hypothetical protein
LHCNSLSSNTAKPSCSVPSSKLGLAVTFAQQCNHYWYMIKLTGTLKRMKNKSIKGVIYGSHANGGVGSLITLLAPLLCDPFACCSSQPLTCWLGTGSPSPRLHIHCTYAAHKNDTIVTSMYTKSCTNSFTCWCTWPLVSLHIALNCTKGLQCIACPLLHALNANSMLCAHTCQGIRSLTTCTQPTGEGVSKRCIQLRHNSVYPHMCCQCARKSV